MTLKEFRDEVRRVNEDSVNHPEHYNQGGIECITAMESAFGEESVISFCLLNAFKYLWRAREKDDFYSNISKAIWYLEYIKETEEEKDE